MQIVDQRLDTYLATICALMPSEVPAASVLEMKQEMRSHLQNALTAFAEMGHAPEEALDLTLTQFGKPHVVATHWQQEWEKTLTDPKTVSLWPSLKLALKVWARADVAMLAICLILPVLTMTNSEMLLRSPLIMTGFFVPPLISGAVIGLRARRHPLLCILLGRLVLLPILITYFICSNLWSQYYITLVTNQPFSLSLGTLLTYSVNGATSFLPLWIILSLLSAGAMLIGKHLIKRRRRQIAR